MVCEGEPYVYITSETMFKPSCENPDQSFIGSLEID